MTVAVVWDGRLYSCAPLVEQAPTVASALILYSQCDPRWVSQIYAGSTTFGAAGCFVVCVSMMVSLAYAERIEPPEVAARLLGAGCFDDNLLSHPANISKAYPQLTWDGAVHYRDRAANMDLVARHIAENGACIAEIAFNPDRPVMWKGADGETKWNQHFVLLTRVVGDDCEFADPWTGELGMLTESRYYRADWPKKASRIITGLRLVGIATED
jgi:hypothetical protein